CPYRKSVTDYVGGAWSIDSQDVLCRCGRDCHMAVHRCSPSVCYRPRTLGLRAFLLLSLDLLRNKAIHQPFPSARHQQRETDADRQYMILVTFTLLLADTAREESVLEMRGGWKMAGAYRSRRDPFIARSTSRLASRVLIDSRRSCCFLPLANPRSALARARLEK